MASYLALVVAHLILWGVFFALVERGAPAIVLWAFFGLAAGSVVWVLHEGIAIATTPMEGRGSGD